MTAPIIVEVPGTGKMLSTWVAMVTFPSMPDDESLAALLVAVKRQKKYQIGTFALDSHRIHFIMRCAEPVQSGQPHTSLVTLFQAASVQARVSKFEAFTPYHLELFGFRPNSGPENPTKSDELDSEEEAELNRRALQWDVTKGLSELDRITDEYFAQREQFALALKPPQLQFGAADAPCIKWHNGLPDQLEVATQRTLREWQKLEWVLFRAQSPAMTTTPTMKHFEAFYAIYSKISAVDDEKKRLKQGFETFACHVKDKTGEVVTKDQLPKPKLVQEAEPEDGLVCYGGYYQITPDPWI
jgi:hypothetical protein